VVLPPLGRTTDQDTTALKKRRASSMFHAGTAITGPVFLVGHVYSVELVRIAADLVI